MYNLQDILPKLRKPNNFPGALPLVHVSKVGKSGFEDIISDLSLSTGKCKVFQKHLLYFSYGDVFYDTEHKPTREEDKLPICFLFNPRVLSKINYYYPYDTGAAYFNKYGRHSNHLKDNFEKYKVNNNSNISEVSRQLVYYIYGSNRNYINSQIKPKIQRKLNDSFPELFDFFGDQNIKECDARQYTIECHANKNIDLKNHLEWIAFPDRYYKLFIKLYHDMQPSPPTPYPYQAGTVFKPLKITGKIQREAQKYIEEKYLLR